VAVGGSTNPDLARSPPHRPVR